MKLRRNGGAHRIAVFLLPLVWQVAQVTFGCALLASAAHADARRAVIVIATKAKPGTPLAELTSTAREALEELESVNLLPPPALDLEAVQLAIGCTDSSAKCLSELGERLDARVLVVPSVSSQRKGSFEAQILCFDRTAGGEPKVATRTAEGTGLGAKLKAEVPTMLRELGLADPEPAPEPEPGPEPGPEPEPVQGGDGSATGGSSSSGSSSGASNALPLGPIVLGGAGVLLSAGGIVLGMLASSTESEYAGRTIETETQARNANELRARGETQALAANVLLGTGIAAMLGAGVWYVLDWRSERHEQTAGLRPLLARDAVGLALWGRSEVLP